MKTFDADLQLRWTQPNINKSVYELRDINGTSYGTLSRNSMWNYKATVDAPGARLEFDSKSTWFKYYVTVTSLGTGEEIARLNYGVWGGVGTLTFATNGAQYRWKSTAWGNKYAWVTLEDELVLGFAVGGFLKPKADVYFDVADPQSTVLVFLGWYLYTLSLEGSAVS